MTMQAPESYPEEQNRPFIRSVFVLLRHWRFLVASFLLAAAAAAVFAFASPNWYKASATFLPPQRQKGLFEQVATGLSSTLKTFGLSGIGSGSSGQYSFLAILKSQSMGERIVREFDLLRVYDIRDSSMEKALQALSNNTEFEFTEEGSVVISVWDTDPKRAADMANAFFENLNEISTRMNATEARANRKFMELQYNSTMERLNALEDTFAVFQKRTKLYSLPEQIKAAVEAAGAIQARLSLQKVYLGILERRLGPDDADVQTARVAVQELEKQIEGFQGADLKSMLGTDFDNLPDEAVTYFRLYREIEVLSKLQGFLLPMYQQSLIEEQKQMTMLVPLDLARVPETKDRPRRSLIILLTGFSVLVLSMALVLIRERMRYYAALYPGEWKRVLDAMKFKKSS